MAKHGLVLFTRDLRVHDNPALSAAVERCERVLPLFVLDDRLLEAFGAPNRVAFLIECLRDLGGSLLARGGDLVIRRGDVVAETVRLARAVGAEVVYVSEDVSAYAQARERRLGRALEAERIALEAFPGVTVVPPGEVAPAGGDAFKVFTPYWRRWRLEPRRPLLDAPARIAIPAGADPGRLPEPSELVPGAPAPTLPRGGEAAGRLRLARWLDDGIGRYEELHDDLAADATSRLSPYLHFGCVSPGEVVERALDRDGGEAFARQLCWRDFNHQWLAADPAVGYKDHRGRAAPWREDPDALEAWKEGRTGFPLVDAGMRQLVSEGWMHNRARLITGSFLTKHLSVDWRAGAEHFYAHLVDGDVANNAGNWQWVAGTGTDSRPNRMLNPERQAQRFDPDAVYARRWIEELGTPDYPEPIVAHEDAVARFREARA
ncbi:MAG: cryptochrome/photolyase family protein [Gaiellaceae bacterium]